MKKLILLNLIFILTFSLGALASERTITVTGDADVNVVPDEVLITVGVESKDKELSVAKEQNDKIVEAILKVTKNFKIESKHVQTDYINIEPNYDDYKTKYNQFFVRRHIVITLKDLSKFEALLTQLIEAGANYVHGIQFRTTELRKHKDNARSLAIQAAKEKATALAGQLDQKIGSPVSITENQTGWWSPYSSWWGGRYGGGMAQNVIQNIDTTTSSEGNLAPGMIKVNAQVTVSFELISDTK